MYFGYKYITLTPKIYRDDITFWKQIKFYIKLDDVALNIQLTKHPGIIYSNYLPYIR